MGIVKEVAKGIFGGKPKVESPPIISQKKITSDAESIANKTIADQKKKNRGFLATINTSPQGLISDENVNTKTLLG